MGIFNNINEKPKHPVYKHLRKPPLYLTSSTEDTDSGLHKWIISSPVSPSLIQKGNTVTIKTACVLIILLDAIKANKGEAELSIIKKDSGTQSTLLQRYKTSNNRRNESISVNYAGRFKTNDLISIESKNVKNVQLTIYGC